MIKTARQVKWQRDAVAFVALCADPTDGKSYIDFLVRLDRAELCVLATKMARWFADELEQRFARERCLSIEEAREEVIAYMRSMAAMLAEQELEALAEEAQQQEEQR